VTGRIPVILEILHSGAGGSVPLWVERSYSAHLASTVEVSGRNAATSQVAYAECDPSEWGVCRRPFGEHEWQNGIVNEKSQRIYSKESGGSRIVACQGEVAQCGSQPQIHVKRPRIQSGRQTEIPRRNSDSPR